MNSVDALISLAEQQARNVLLVLHQPLMPTWVIIDKHGRPHICGTPWENDREKYLAGLAMKLQMRKLGAKAYSFITEAWCAQAPKDWDPDTPLPEKDRAMNQPDRLEVVIAFATDGDQCEWRRWTIRRNWNEQIICLEPAQDNFEKPEGWIAELLKD